MSRYVDLATSGQPVGRCIVLPGRQYTADGPLLFFAAQAAMARGWDVREVWWDAQSRGAETFAAESSWVGEQLDQAVADHDGRVLVVAKSLGTLAAPVAARRGYDAAWLTPLLTEPDLADAILTYPTNQFTLIGFGDQYLDREVFDALPGRRVLVPGNHVLVVAGDLAATMESHTQFALAFDEWLGELTLSG